MNVKGIQEWVSRNPKKFAVMATVALAAFIAYQVLSSKGLLPDIKQIKSAVALPLAPIIPFYLYVNRNS